MTTSASKCTSRSTTPGNASARQLAQSVALAIPPVTLSATNSASTCGICGHGGTVRGTVRPPELTTAEGTGGGGGPGDSDVNAPAAMAIAIDTPKSVSMTQAAAANWADLLPFHGMLC